MAANKTRKKNKRAKIGELVENRIIVWDIKDSQTLFGNGYYGKPIGMPKPKIEEIDVPLVLDLIEGLYLLENDEIVIVRRVHDDVGLGDGSTKKNTKTRGTKKTTKEEIVTVEQMRDICRNEYHAADKKCAVYKIFRDRGYIINPGIKFGCDFAVYERGPGIDHAPYLVQVYSKNQPITSTGIVLAGRLATTVRKQFILAIPGAKESVDFLALDWWRA